MTPTLRDNTNNNNSNNNNPIWRSTSPSQSALELENERLRNDIQELKKELQGGGGGGGGGRGRLNFTPPKPHSANSTVAEIPAVAPVVRSRTIAEVRTPAEPQIARFVPVSKGNAKDLRFAAR